MHPMGSDRYVRDGEFRNVAMCCALDAGSLHSKKSVLFTELKCLSQIMGSFLLEQDGLFEYNYDYSKQAQ